MVISAEDHTTGVAFLLLFCAPESPRGLTQAEAAAEASHRVPEAGDANG